MITSKQRVEAALERRDIDRCPLDLSFTSEAEANIRRYLELSPSDDLYGRLGLDVRKVYPKYVGPVPRIEGNTRFDEWGIGHASMHYEGEGYAGVYEELAVSPLADARSVDDVLSYPWPDPDWWDYSSLTDSLDALGGEFWVASGYYSVFERAWGMIGMERLLTDMVVEPEILLAVFDKILDFYIEQSIRILEAGKGLIHQIDTCDDVGTQRGMILSPKVWREHIKPRQAKFNAAMKQRFPVKIQYHCCGSLVPVVDDLIEIGVDILDPIQTLATDMEPGSLKDQFGERLCFHGGLDTQQILPYGTPEEVAAEARNLIATLGAGGGYILAPTHTVQADVPPENVLAVCRASVQCGVR